MRIKKETDNKFYQKEKKHLISIFLEILYNLKTNYCLIMSCSDFICQKQIPYGRTVILLIYTKSFEKKFFAERGKQKKLLLSLSWFLLIFEQTGCRENWSLNIRDYWIQREKIRVQFHLFFNIKLHFYIF